MTQVKNPHHIDTAPVRAFLQQLQNDIVDALQSIDGQAFRCDTWQRPNQGGSGDTRVSEGGAVLERGGFARERAPGWDIWGAEAEGGSDFEMGGV